MKWVTRIAGAAVWLAVFVGIALGVRAGSNEWAGELATYAVSAHRSFALQVPSPGVRSLTPIYSKQDDQWQLVGHVRKVRQVDQGQTVVDAEWYGPGSLDAYQLHYFESSNSLASVVQVLLPPDRRTWVEQRLKQLFDEHSEELIEALKPIFERSVRQSLPVIEDELKLSIERHREEIDRIAERYKNDIVKQQLLPLVKDEIFPIVRQHAEPLARDIGRELWDRASLWRFGWRYVYDKSPLPNKRLVKEEWERFVNEEAIPVLQSHTDEMIDVQRRIFADISANPRIREQLQAIGQAILHDQELKSLVGSVLRESILENKPLRDVWLNNWQSPDAKAALELVGDRIEPVMREIGDAIFGTRESGITPEFARVLRTQILGKDKRWFVAYRLDNPASSSGGVIVAQRGDPAAEAPVLLMGSAEL